MAENRDQDDEHLSESSETISEIISRIRSQRTEKDKNQEDSNSTHRSKLLKELGLLSLDSESGQKVQGYSRQDVNAALEQRFLTPKRAVGERQLGRYQVHWPHEPSYVSLLPVSPTHSQTSLTFLRSGLDGRITGHTETTRSSNPIADAKGSTSLNRAPAGGASFVRGKSSFVPFEPGGLDGAIKKHDDDEEDGAEGDLDQSENQAKKEALEKDVLEMENALDSKKGLRYVPPGFSRGLFGTGLEDEDEEEEDEEEDAAAQHQDAARGLRPAPVYRPIGGSAPSQSQIQSQTSETQTATHEMDAELDELLPVERPLVSSRRAPRSLAKRDWAHVVDVNQTLSNFHELVPDMAHKFPFELDNFQKEAVYHLEQGDSVFVAAHTSAGKTVVAEYAISLAQKHMTRCIYTSPIKALSNQKFRDFKETFGAQNVGILTGDVQINPEAPCLIMTTEILRSMLYRGADLIRDVEFVIFDEVHYVNDSERGVVWEEVIILCPSHINLILLSATVPNTKEFADWVGRTKKKDIYVISTPKRPVPLEHFLYAGKDLFKIVDAKGQFLNNGIKDAGESLRRKQDKDREAGLLPPIRGRGAAAAGSRGGRGAGANSRGGQRGAMAPVRGRGGSAGGGGGQRGAGDKNLWIHMIGLLKKKSLLPVVVFVFSKKRCEEYAGSMPNTDLCNAREKSEVHIIIEKSLTRLKGSDRKLPQIERMRDLLSRGVGVHHGGLLPIVKEVVEILFARGLVKVLFATETFAMGVNMPARSVVFSGIRKHDGHSFRELLAGEYTQMSGRAGRRGLDPTGVVIINAADELPETAILHKMLLGQPTKLQSQFRLTYNMILNLLRVEALKVEEMIKRSFSENSAQKLLPDQEKKVKEIEKELSKLPKLDQAREEDLSLKYDLSLEAVSSNEGLLQMALDQQQASKNFASGRVVLLRDAHFDNSPAVIVKSVARQELLVLAAVTPERKSGSLDLPSDKVPPQWPPHLAGHPTSGLVYDLREVPLSSIALVTKHTLKIELSMILAHRISAMNSTVELLLPLISEMSKESQLPEVDWSKARRLDFQEMIRSRDGAAARLVSSEIEDGEDFVKEYRIVDSRKRLERQINSLRLAISDQNLELLPDYEQRVAVLQALRFVDPISQTVLLKGRVACEINSANERELVLTELILDNTFASFSPEETVALLSVFVFQEKSDNQPELSPKLEEGYYAIMAVAERVSAIQTENRVNFEDYAESLKTGLVEVVYEWARGMPFEKITDLTDVAEGTIVRCITRLDETCREVRDAARVIGDADLFTKMEECQALIRRDIVFAASLYF